MNCDLKSLKASIPQLIDNQLIIKSYRSIDYQSALLILIKNIQL